MGYTSIFLLLGAVWCSATMSWGLAAIEDMSGAQLHTVEMGNGEITMLHNSTYTGSSNKFLCGCPIPQEGCQAQYYQVPSDGTNVVVVQICAKEPGKNTGCSCDDISIHIDRRPQDITCDQIEKWCRKGTGGDGKCKPKQDCCNDLLSSLPGGCSAIGEQAARCFKTQCPDNCKGGWRGEFCRNARKACLGAADVGGGAVTAECVLYLAS